MVSEERIRYWAKIYNEEIGRSDRIEESVSYFMRLVGIAGFIDTEEYYIVYLIDKDMWGDKFLCVSSFYIKPEYRTGKYFLKMQREIQALAKANKVVYTIQGSHIDEKYFKFLSGIGYRVCEMRKDN